ncbi:MAG: TetR family transcriptional regulator [Ruminococcaceae bacterium]|nr:TetR family transcriptional regulator [Oscillospiraceae bacterium]
MYRKQTNKTALLSQHLIADALLRLMRKEAFQSITITDICNEAGVGRKTFYRNFELREDVIDFQLDLLCAEYARAICGISIEERLFYHFAFIHDHTDFFIALYQSGLDYLAHQKFSVLLPETMPVWSEDPIRQEYHSQYVIAGIEAVQRVWISRGCQESIDEVISMVQQIHAGQS